MSSVQLTVPVNRVISGTLPLEHEYRILSSSTNAPSELLSPVRERTKSETGFPSVD